MRFLNFFSFSFPRFLYGHQIKEKIIIPSLPLTLTASRNICARVFRVLSSEPHLLNLAFVKLGSKDIQTGSPFHSLI